MTDDESLSLPFTIGVPCAYRAPRPGLPLVTGRVDLSEGPPEVTIEESAEG